ncbi:branched-chain amino acid ABC transporter substrate-binding protein [Deinococcus maricopensis]|uniref:Extracellular ligand-binding receptor n=1 Tax=Deinococcus maricopensis (strain DSM 21211 / LMG 22137 / NRRL B-23946 / LB-34) TaxID=709986 RepID=E8U9N5_DEIML|nr:branched-chain amino acid ABC transporter substrate-binding protein [Deinococcus maricopensis]ADV67774.1 Extracellular ligand-binding receptor [Deinococcus maricopensis DSM 21211]
MRSKLTALLGIAAALALSTASAATIRIATISPLSGDLSSPGTEVKRGATIALSEHQADFKALGIDLQLVTYDDQANPTQGEQLAKKVAADNSVLGIVGALNSGVTNAVAAALVQSPVALITPTSTNDKLTQNGWNFFSRVVAPDSAQGNAAAQYMADTFKSKKVYVVSDNTTYGNGLTRQLMSALKARGISIVAYTGASSDEDIAKLVPRIKASGADSIYFGGTDDVGGNLIKSLRAAGVKANIMGADGLDNKAFLSRAGTAAAGVAYTTGFGPLSGFTNRFAFDKAYRAMYNSAPNGISAYAYDATNTLLEAIKSAAKNSGGTPTRAQVIQAVRKTNQPACASVTDNCRSITGAVAFTPNGERQRTLVYVMNVDPTYQIKISKLVVVNAADLEK